MRAALHAFVIVLLTVLTQIGGLAWLITLLVRRWHRMVAFPVAYLALSLATLAVAPQFGRVPLPCFSQSLGVVTPLYCVLHRHYVTPEMRNYAEGLAGHMQTRFPGTVTLALDANFPFVEGFPLLPHLSHDDGRKLDLAFYYENNGAYVPGKTASPIGYWAFAPPAPGAALPCAGRGNRLTLRWDMGWLQPLMRDMHIEPRRLRTAIDWLVTEAPAGYRSKILLEPHLKATLGFGHDIVRFQGCRAARYDDHIHVQIDAL